MDIERVGAWMVVIRKYTSARLYTALTLSNKIPSPVACSNCAVKHQATLGPGHKIASILGAHIALEI